jgi:polysaccharide biosynthesis/export protein
MCVAQETTIPLGPTTSSQTGAGASDVNPFSPYAQPAPIGQGQYSALPLLPGGTGNGLDASTLARLLGGQPQTQTENQEGNKTENKTIRPILEKSEFELFVEDAIGHPLEVYGRQLFEEVPSTFAPLEHVPVPANYVIGPGDELQITTWGKVNLDLDPTVDRNGQIAIPKVGQVTVAGLHYDELGSHLHQAIGAIYKDFELNVALGQLRSIQIFVLGNARQPGSYTLSSLSTLVDALFASGGPSATGSMRRIDLLRNAQIATEFDIYDLMQKGDKSRDIQLLPGDVIFIPPVGPRIAIDGSVNQAGIFELKGKGTVGAALDVAGGLTALASVDRLVLERIRDHKVHYVETVELNEAGKQRVLEDGDLLRVTPLTPRFESAVTLRGNVALPGRFPWHEGMRISDLIPSRDFLITREHWYEQNHLADQQNHLFDHGDRLLDQQSQNFAAAQAAAELERPQTDPPAIRRTMGSASSDEEQLVPRGNAGERSWIEQGQASEQNHVQPGQYAGLGMPGQNMQSGTSGLSTLRNGKLSIDPIEDLNRINAEINWDYAAVERLDDRDLTTHLISFHLANAIDNPASADNLVLRSGDVVTVFSRDDIPLPLEKHSVFVRVSGEVSAPGVYRMNPNETLRDVVSRAGGLTSHSYLYGATLTRASTRALQERQLNEAVDRMRTELAYANVNALSSPAAMQTTSGAATGADAMQEASFRAQEALLGELSREEPTGRIVLGIKPTANRVDDIPEFPLEDGDDFTIPAELSTVQVAGEVYNQVALRYQSRKRLIAYLNDSGGPTRQADEKRIFLIRADGTVVNKHGRHGHSAGDFEKLIPMPGDTIVVPMRVRSGIRFTEELPMITQMLSTSALMGALVAK